MLRFNSPVQVWPESNVNKKDYNFLVMDQKLYIDQIQTSFRLSEAWIRLEFKKTRFPTRFRLDLTKITNKMNIIFEIVKLLSIIFQSSLIQSYKLRLD